MPGSSGISQQDFLVLNVVIIVAYVLFLRPRTDSHHVGWISSSLLSGFSSRLPFGFSSSLLSGLPLRLCQMAIFAYYPGLKMRNLGCITRRKRRLWTRDRSSGGFWERHIALCDGLSNQGYHDIVDIRYMEAFRMSKLHFDAFVREYGGHLAPSPGLHGRGTPQAKRVGLLLYWLAHGDSQRSLARKYAR